jgi:hypothetical protein
MARKLAHNRRKIKAGSCISFLLLALILFVNFLGNVSAQVAIPLSEINPELDKPLDNNVPLEIAKFLRGISDIEAIGEQLFVSTGQGLWMFSKGGEQATRVVSGPGVLDRFDDDRMGVVKGTMADSGSLMAAITKLEVVGERLFATTPKGLWIISSDGKLATKIESVKGDFFGFSRSAAFPMAVLDERLFISTDQGLWRVSGDGEQVDKIEIANEFAFGLVAIGERLLVMTKEDSLILNKYGEQIVRLKGIGFLASHDFSGGRLFVVKDKSLLVLNEDDQEFITLMPVDSGLDFSVTAIDTQIFISLDGSLWALTEGGQHLVKADEKLRAYVYSIKAVRDRLFISTKEGLWTLVKNNHQADKVKGLEGKIFRIADTEEHVFAFGDESMWIVSTDGKQADRITSIIPKGETKIVSAGNRAYILFTKYDQDGSSSTSISRIDSKVKINTWPSTSGWFATAIGYVLPSNWLPAEKVRVQASYSDEAGTDPYDETIPREFRFAKADGDTLASDDKFSTQEQFSYEIGWGRNSVRYWVKDRWGNVFLQTATYYGVPSQYFFVTLPFILSIVFVLACLASAPKVDFSHSAIMNPWLRKYFSLGSVPLLLSIFPALRRHILKRYTDAVSKDNEIEEWKERFVYPDEVFLPDNFGKRLESERRLLLTGQSGIGKTSFFKHLTAYYVSQDKPMHPAKVFPIYISLTNYGGNSLEELVYTQLFSYGKITDRELAPMFLEQGGLLIFLDGVNEVQNVSDRQKLSEFVEKFWTSNYICLSSQQRYPEIENLPRVELKAFGPEKVREFLRQRVNERETAKRVIKSLTGEDYQLYSVPRDLEYAVEILNNGAKSLPKSRTELYEIIFSAIFARWKDKGSADSEDILCERAYKMIVEREMAFDSVNNPRFKEITADLREQKFLITREESYYFRHDLIRAYLASEFFYPRWENLFKKLEGKPIDSNWLEMLKFACEKISGPAEVKSLLYEVLDKSVRKDLVKSLFRWLKDNQPVKCSSWETDFYAKYGESEFS